MNQLPTHSSQITQENGALVIDTSSLLAKRTLIFLQYSFLLFLGITIISIIIFFIPINSDVNFIARIVMFLSGMITIFLFQIFDFFSLSFVSISDVIFDSTTSQSIQLKNIPTLDLRVEFFKEKVRVQIMDIRFTLNNPQNLPILTDRIEREANVEFYENSKISEHIEVITYKSKRLAKPNFSSLLTVVDNNQTIRIYDMLNNTNWFEIELYSKPLKINYKSKGEFLINNIQKIIIETNANAGVLNKPILTVNIVTDEKEQLIFKTTFRKSSDEITNRRDGEKIHNLLSNLSVLKKVEIEHQIIN